MSNHTCSSAHVVAIITTSVFNDTGVGHQNDQQFFVCLSDEIPGYPFSSLPWCTFSLVLCKAPFDRPRLAGDDENLVHVAFHVIFQRWNHTFLVLSGWNMMKSSFKFQNKLTNQYNLIQFHVSLHLIYPFLLAVFGGIFFMVALPFFSKPALYKADVTLNGPNLEETTPGRSAIIVKRDQKINATNGCISQPNSNLIKIHQDTPRLV